MQKISNNPGNYIAQPILDLSTVPIFKKDSLSPRHVDLRPFTLIGNRKSKLVAGGLTRVALKEGSLVVNLRKGEELKIPGVGETKIMLSRTAENLYWTARYVERADSIARLLEVAYRIHLIPNTEEGYMNEWESILQASE